MSVSKKIDPFAKKRHLQFNQWKQFVDESLISDARGMLELSKLILNIDARLKKIERGDCNG